MKKSNNEELELAYQYAMYTHRNIFLTGKAGTGKTTFLRQLIQDTFKRNIVVAPTGVAAINANGVTIHSFFQLAPGLMPRNDLKFQFSKHKLNILRALDLLIIDEISMVRCDLLDAIDEVLRRYQDRSKPFGGVQVLMIGDLQQLAPVATEEEWNILKQRYTTPYFFSAKVFDQTNFTTIELKKVYRQDNEDFIRILNNVRDNRIDQQTLDVLNSRYIENFNPDDKEGYITLTTHNAQAQVINQEHMDKLKTHPETFTATTDGEFPETSYPTDFELTLKIGAQVMFCKNDSSGAKRYYNGKIGRVAQIYEDKVIVVCNEKDAEEDVIEVKAEEWTNAKYETNDETGEINEVIVGTFKQIPLRTAWAITIHKSQGLTFDKAIINAGHAFSFGQVYVALSRCRSLEGLVLSTPISRNVVMSDPTISAFNREQEQNRPTPERLAQDRKNYVAEIICSIFNFNKLQKSLDYVARLADMYLDKTDPEYVQRAKTAATETRTKLTDVGNRFAFQICDLMNLADTYEDNPQLKERFKKGNNYFVTQSTEILTDFMEEEIPVMKNKQHKERYLSEFELLKQEYLYKTGLLIKTMTGFTLQKYWDMKAKSSMTEETAPKKKSTKSASTKSKTKKKKKSSSYFDD